MARPGQHQARRKRDHPHDSDTDSEDGRTPGNGKARVLPVAEIPEGWHGEAEDGATYLALTAREAAQLPFTTRAPLPGPDPATDPSLSSQSNGVGPSRQPAPGHAVEDEYNAAARGPKQRHPALPHPSWEELYPGHFCAYRHHLRAALQQHPPPPMKTADPPLPRSDDRDGWYMYIHGISPIPKSGPSGQTHGSYDEADENEDNAEVEQDEEAMMNEEAAVNEEEAMNAAVEEREPVLSALVGLQDFQLVRILGHINHWTSETLDEVSSSLLLPTSPTATVASTSAAAAPLTPLYTRWIFALLLLLPPAHELPASHTSDLRELGRTAMKVGGWRWVRGVGDGEVGGEGWVMGEGRGGGRGQRAGAGDAGDRGNVRDTGDGLDETLARCWIVVYAIAGGWGQWDLIEELRTLFS